jgi:hypothetical protein
MQLNCQGDLLRAIDQGPAVPEHWRGPFEMVRLEVLTRSDLSEGQKERATNVLDRMKDAVEVADDPWKFPGRRVRRGLESLGMI